MAVSDQVINVIELDGTTKQIKLYTEISDVTEVYKDFLYKGQTLYASTTIDPDDEYATGLKYLDNGGVVRYLCTENPIPEKSGTVIINGDLNTDLVVDGNLQVSGTISGNATVSGTITYGKLTGTVKENATFLKCDISVDGGTLTFNGSISKKDDAFYTAETITNENNTTTNLYSNFIVETDSQYCLCNNCGNLIVMSGAEIGLTSTHSTGRGIWNDGGTLTVMGAFTINSKDVCIYNYGASAFSHFIMDNDSTVNAICSGSTYAFWNSRGTTTINGILTTTASDSGGIGFGNYMDTFIIDTDGIATITGGLYAIRNHYTSTVNVKGTLYTNAPDVSSCIYGGSVTITDSGKIYKNGVLQ